MLVLTSIILFSFFFGYLLSNLLSASIDRHAKYGHSYSYNKYKSILLSSSRQKPVSFCNCGVFLFSNSHFDPRTVKLPLHADENLQQIFDIVIGRFILRWFALLTDDKHWLAEVKAELQHICSVILLRLKTIDIFDLIEEKLLPCIVHHVEHLLALTEAFFKSTGEDEETFRPPSADEVVLQRLFSADHLHPALQSRQAESLYLQGIVRQLLPYLLTPPGLKRSRRVRDSKPPARNEVFQVPSVIDQTFSSPQYHYQMPNQAPVQNNHHQHRDLDPNHTQTSQCALAFLTEILANHILLPALDSIANPDSLNSVLLYLINPVETDIDYPPKPPMVPLLNSYVNDWFEHNKELHTSTRMEALLQQPKQLANFVQYMKSINCSPTMTALLLMFEVVSKIEKESVSLELCERLKAPLHQLLCLLHGGRVWTGEELKQHSQGIPNNNHNSSISRIVCRECGRNISQDLQPCLAQLLGLPVCLIEVISEALDSVTTDVNADSFCVARLVHTPEWTDAYKTICATMEAIYLPMYLKSPEFLGRMGAFSRSSSPKQPFSSLDNVASNSLDVGDIFGVSGFSLDRPFYKMPTQSNSFADINELNRRSVTRMSNSVAMDDMSASTLRSNGLRNQQHLRTSAETTSTTTTTGEESVVEMEDLDFSKWRVFISRYTPSRTHVPMGNNLSELRSSAPHNAVAHSNPVMKMNLEEHEFSVFSSVSSSQGYYTVTSEREVKGKKLISKVNRKYAEFYVLEQRLVEFHGSQISIRMRPRQLGAQSRQFLDGMKTYFERFLKYLLALSFLRTSELLHRFLTSTDVEFTSGNLSDIRLGKFVKSVPILLAKEKGQFTDEFLNLFRASCFVPVSSPTATANRYHNADIQSSHSALEHRLHSQMYWNNAAIPLLQKRVHSSEYCAMEGTYVTSFYDFFGYLVDSLGKFHQRRSFDTTQTPIVEPKPANLSVYADLLHWAQRLASVCWFKLHSFWCGLLCALGLSPSSLLTPSMDISGLGLQTYLRRAFLNLALVLRKTQIRDLVDLHVRRGVERFLQLLGRNDYFAPMLLLLRDSVFFPSSPRNDQSKAERRKEAADGIRRLIDHFYLQWVSDQDILQRHLDRVFEIFQHSKWNKQLVYTLLDHILLELFPDAFVASVGSMPTETRPSE